VIALAAFVIVAVGAVVGDTRPDAPGSTAAAAPSTVDTPGGKRKAVCSSHSSEAGTG
jgi:hypothetical protein